jgi:arabinose-5-phosphate isomerase
MDILAIGKKVFDDEIQELIKIKNKLDDNFVKVINLIAESKGKLIISGVGKSGLIGQKISATLSSTGTPSFFLNPTEAYHGDLGVVEINNKISFFSTPPISP